jgi:hypothetical protein
MMRKAAKPVINSTNALGSGETTGGAVRGWDEGGLEEFPQQEPTGDGERKRVPGSEGG